MIKTEIIDSLGTLQITKQDGTLVTLSNTEFFTAKRDFDIWCAKNDIYARIDEETDDDDETPLYDKAYFTEDLVQKLAEEIVEQFDECDEILMVHENIILETLAEFRHK